MTTTIQQQERDTDHEDRRCLYCNQRSATLICKACNRELIEQARDLRS